MKAVHHPTVRLATDDELGTLPHIEADADAMFLQVGIELPPGQMTVEALRGAKAVFVIGEPISGFACLDELDGVAHLTQIAVRPDQAGQGYGSALIAAAVNWAQAQEYEAMTLTTFREVPWNGPFYAHRGFELVDEGDYSPGLASCRSSERNVGLDDLSPRVAMRRPL